MQEQRREAGCEGCGRQNWSREDSRDTSRRAPGLASEGGLGWGGSTEVGYPSDCQREGTMCAQETRPWPPERGSQVPPQEGPAWVKTPKGQRLGCLLKLQRQKEEAQGSR